MLSGSPTISATVIRGSREAKGSWKIIAIRRRNFRIGREGKLNLQIRAEFQNVFNRHFYAAPNSTNLAALTAKTNLNNTALSAGFGFVNFVNGSGSRPRTALMVARFTF